MDTSGKLRPITNPLNSCLFERDFDNVDRVFKMLSNLAENLTRTKVVKKGRYLLERSMQKFSF